MNFLGCVQVEAPGCADLPGYPVVFVRRRGPYVTSQAQAPRSHPREPPHHTQLGLWSDSPGFHFLWSSRLRFLAPAPTGFFSEPAVRSDDAAHDVVAPQSSADKHFSI